MELNLQLLEQLIDLFVELPQPGLDEVGFLLELMHLFLQIGKSLLLDVVGVVLRVTDRCTLVDLLLDLALHQVVNVS